PFFQYAVPASVRVLPVRSVDWKRTLCTLERWGRLRRRQASTTPTSPTSPVGAGASSPRTTPATAHAARTRPIAIVRLTGRFRRSRIRLPRAPPRATNARSIPLYQRLGYLGSTSAAVRGDRIAGSRSSAESREPRQARKGAAVAGRRLRAGVPCAPLSAQCAARRSPAGRRPGRAAPTRQGCPPVSYQVLARKSRPQRFDDV